MHNVDFLNILLFVYANNDLRKYSTDSLKYYHNILLVYLLLAVEIFKSNSFMQTSYLND